MKRAFHGRTSANASAEAPAPCGLSGGYKLGVSLPTPMVRQTAVTGAEKEKGGRWAQGFKNPWNVGDA